MFKFEHINSKDFKNNNRDDFANTVCKLIYEKYKGNLEEIFLSNELQLIYKQFNEHVRNIYELIDTDIPLFSFYELKKQETDKGRNRWGMTENEYKEAIQRTITACEDYYSF